MQTKHDLSLKGLRLVAMLEAAKGMLVLLAGFGLLSFIHQNAQEIAEAIIKDFHLNPASHYPRIFMELAGKVADVRLWMLALMAASYAVMRLIEAYGLWNGRRWAEWFAVASGGIYMPFEIYELVKGISWIKISTLGINVVVVAYMAYALWESRKGNE